MAKFWLSWMNLPQRGVERHPDRRCGRLRAFRCHHAAFHETQSKLHWSTLGGHSLTFSDGKIAKNVAKGPQADFNKQE